MRGPAAKESKRKAAEIRQVAHNKLSNAEKLAKLDKNLGVGVGAKKERAKYESR